MPALIGKVPGFTKHIRVFIVHTLATTFQAASRQTMEQCLDLVRQPDDGYVGAALLVVNSCCTVLVPAFCSLLVPAYYLVAAVGSDKLRDV